MFLLNGQDKHTLAVTDRGFHYGDGLFETLEVIAGQPLFLDWHLERLNRGCRRLLIPVCDTAQLIQESRQLCAGAQRAVLKILITRGSGGRGYRQPPDLKPTRLLGLYPHPDYPESYAQHGIKLRFCQHPVSINPALAGIKHLNRLDQVLARAEWQDDTIQEGIMCDPEGNLIEGTMSNLFWVRDGDLFTPTIERAGIDGIVRQWLLAHAQRAAINCRMGRYPAEALLQADEIFVTNSLIGIWPVKRLADQAFNIGPVTRMLQQAWQQIRQEQMAC